MINIQEFDKFVDEVSKAFRIFSTWVHTNNMYAEHPNNFLSGIMQSELWEFKMFWINTCHSLQQTWMLGVARLLDHGYHKNDVEKLKPRLSIDYILQKINDDELTKKYNEFKSGQKKFIFSNRQIRDNSLAHKSIIESFNKQKAGAEEFFDFLENMINKIKEKYPELIGEYTFNQKKIEAQSKSGAEQIFNKLV